MVDYFAMDCNKLRVSFSKSTLVDLFGKDIIVKLMIYVCLFFFFFFFPFFFFSLLKGGTYG